MTMLMEFFGHPLVHALGWTLLHFFWQGAAVAGLLWCVLALLSGRSSQSRYAASCFALLLLVALPLITFAHIAANEYRMRAELTGGAVPIDLSLILQVGAGGPAEPWTARMAGVLDHSLPGLLALWFAGVIFFVARLNFGLLVARRLKAAGTETPPEVLLQAFDALRIRLGIERAVRLLHSARVQVPTVIGWLRPVVLIPASCLTGLSMDQIEAIFCHELAHVRRHDYLVSVFQSVAEALLFYHPAVWWVSKQVRRERECCCDEVAVAHGGDVLAYAKALSYLEERRASFPEFVLGANGGVLTMRIKRILGCKENAAASQCAAFTVLAVVLAVAGSYAVTAARAQAAAKAANAIVSTPVGGGGQDASAGIGTPDAARRTIAQSLTSKTYVANDDGTVYSRWLNQDVAWIITDQERATFLGLTNDAQRDQFIENFWQRRNPTPDAADNPFRDEHYARIAYANQHFANSGRPGWSTDRGHVYIAYGKPYEIDSHPSGGETYPYEVWSYRSIGGIGDNVDPKFVDTCRCGDYRFSMDGLAAGPGTAALQTKQFDRLSVMAKVMSPVKISYAPQNATPPSANAAQADASISGTILDPTGALVPRANVKTVNTDTGKTLTRVTDNTGAYSFSPVPPGPYNVEVEAKGFQRQLQENVHVGAGQSVKLNLKLTVGAASENLTVTGKVVAAAPPPPPPPVAVGSGKQGGPVPVSSGVMAGLAIKMVQPVYPPEAKAARVQGVVVLHAVISKAGGVENLQVISGPPPLLVSSIDAVRQWKYKPYLLNGEPTAVDTTININYTFEGSTDSQGEKPAAEYGGIAPKKIGGNISAPVVIYQVEPEYTEEARKAKFMGIVLVNLVVDQQGHPQNVHILRGVGMGLDAKAVEAVSQYRFRPAMEAGKPVPVDLNVEVNFQIFPDKDGATAALHVPLRNSLPVLIASLNPLQFPLSKMVLAGPAATLRLIPMSQVAFAAERGPALQSATTEQNDSQHQLSDEQRAQIEAQIAAAKRETAEAAKRLTSPEFRKLIEDAQRQAADAKKRMDSPEFRKQIEDAKNEAMEAAKRLNSPEFRKQMEDAKRQAAEAKERMNSPEFRKQMEDAKNQAMAAAKELNGAEFRKLLDGSNIQIYLHRNDLDSPEFRKDMEEVRRQIDAAAEELREAGALADPPAK